MKTIQILLSTYNGEKYIREQLDSILNQDGVDLSILVRDDGSTDNTLQILEEYKNQYSNIEIIKGENAGYESSFMQLVEKSGDFDYYAFADQDDIWKPEKLQIAVASIEKKEIDKPTMYFSNCELVNEKAEHIGYLRSGNDFIPKDKTQAIVLGFVHGCTMVFNRASQQLINSATLNYNLAHDNWIPLLHFYMGEWIYDSNSYILYRQHGNNTFGSENRGIALVKKKLRDFKKNSRKYSQTAAELLRNFKSELKAEDIEVLEKISNYRKQGRFYLLRNSSMKRSTFTGTLYLKFLILISQF